jgi:uncharacterized protein (DUF2062 family)/2-polyprenyl-3-methyl-5-hydroxy-6-metoxy-1,4-benzoquinol methylase
LKKYQKPFRELLYRLRTEGGSPGRVAAAVGIGVFIGCSPFYGFHLLLCLIAARLLRLNRMLTYLASHISLPGVWPLLALAEVQLARHLRGVAPMSIHPADLRHLNFRQLGGDLLLGSVLVGAVLAVAFALPTWWIARRRSREPEITVLIEEAAYRYLDTGMFNWEFVRGKLRHDPLYFHLLRQGVLPPGGRLLDLGCGRGILFSLLLSARAQHERGVYPEAWAPPPPDLTFLGIEGSAKAGAVARKALGEAAEIEIADLCTAALPAADTVLLFDVLHYLPAEAQEDLLARVAAVLPPGGLLLIRDADAAGGWRFTAARIQERLATLARWRWRQRFRYRSRAEWSAILEELGFAVIDEPMGTGTPYANVLITARR